MPNPHYRKMFKDLKEYEPKLDALKKLATIMSGKLRLPVDDEEAGLVPETVPDEIPGIPAGYTYLAQFISHDITFDEASDRHRREDFPSKTIDQASLEKLRNLRNLAFDLEAIYGHINPTNKGEISRSQLLLKDYTTTLSNKPYLPLLRLGNTKGAELGTAGKSYPNDLPRKNACVEANIVDPRNDENLLLAQTQVAFTKFHNALVVKLNKKGNYTYEKLFNKARELTIRYYQTIILTDFLPKIVQTSVLKDVIAKLKTRELFYQPERDDMFMPLEFSVAAFRFAHSMIRNKYNINKSNSDTSLHELMMLTGKGEMNGIFPHKIRLNLPSSWIVNWNLFYQIDDSKLNHAEQINTLLPSALLNMVPKPLFRGGGQASALAILDLYRGRRFRLPAGQDVAEAIENGSSLKPEQIKALIMSKQVDNEPQAEVDDVKKELCETFGERTPLWFYILAEAEIQADDEIQAGAGFENAGKLGAVGSRIVAETIVQLLNNSEYSILQQDWKDDEGFLLKTDPTSDVPEMKRTFDMPAMLKFIQETCEEHFEELYPRKHYPETRNRFDELNPLEKGYQETD